MKSIRLSDALVSDDILIVGLAKGVKADTLKIESGSVSLDEKSLLFKSTRISWTHSQEERKFLEIIYKNNTNQ